MRELEQMLAASHATQEFKDDVRRFYQSGRAERIHLRGPAPAVKVTRLLKRLLSAEPTLPIERIALDATSGCSDFTGIVEILAGAERRSIQFLWDCRWRAEQEGWIDWFGEPDQIRAAREFDWQCFREWRSRAEPA